jgi:L-fuconolactonase
LSGLVTLADQASWCEAALQPYSDAVLDLFGADRVMFGSDWPICLLAASYEQVVSAASELLRLLSPGERDQVFGGSAQRWYQLETESSR